jgi:hypothetical protein
MFAVIGTAPGHLARIHIVHLLLKRRSCIGCDIVDEVRLAQSTVPGHPGIFKAANISVCRAPWGQNGARVALFPELARGTRIAEVCASSSAKAS